MSATSFEAPSLEDLAGLLPAYEFHSFIAQGGMGAVYKARQRALDRDVAVKVLPRELGEDPAFRHSFETEAKAMARLNHPNLIGVYDSGDIDGMLYIVMEYVNGKSLYHSAYNLRVDPEQAAALVKGICDGLAHAHENGVIHRDIKPANILLNEKVVPKIGDFGLARPADESAGLTMGTPGYTAPEIYKNPEHFDVRTDIYAVGVILYELLTGHKPEDEDMKPPSTVVKCDKKLDAIWKKSTDTDPARRYASAEEMGNDLEGWANWVPPAPSLQVAPSPPSGPRPHAPQVGQSVMQVRSATPVAPRRAPASMVMHQKKADMTVPIILVSILVVGGGLVGYQMVKSSKNQREVAEKHEAVEKENARIRAANEAAKKKKEYEDKNPDPSTIRFAPEGKPEQPAPPVTPEVPKGAEPPPP